MTNAASACRAIQAANSASDVITVVRDYLSELGAEKAALLPGTLLSLGIDHAQEIAAAALEVSRREAQATAEEAAFLKDAGIVLSTAAMRLVVLGSAIQAVPQTL